MAKENAGEVSKIGRPVELIWQEIGKSHGELQMWKKNEIWFGKLKKARNREQVLRTMDGGKSK